MNGLYITIGILVLYFIFLAAMSVYPILKKYKLQIKRVETKKRRTKTAPKKKRKSVWIRVV